jgi:chaperonin GroEL (HSP60 family)
LPKRHRCRSGEMVVERIRSGESGTSGFNAAAGQYEDLRKAIDPAEVTRSALQNAAPTPR